jgi:hypothetical protein
VAANEAFVSVGITADTAEFAVAAIRAWLERMGRHRYPRMSELTITADCGGSNGARVLLYGAVIQARPRRPAGCAYVTLACGEAGRH